MTEQNAEQPGDRLVADPGPSPEAPAEADVPAADDVDVAIEEAEADGKPDERSVEELRAALLEAERLRDSYLDQAQRSRAEYHNLRRRSDEALTAALDRGAERLLTQMFGVLDNFGYLTEATSEDDETQLAKGLRMVYSELFAALEGAGLEPISGVGSVFDPTVHDALLSEEAGEPLDEPVVIEVLRPGYRFKGRTLRPASVKVAR
jgi:molecular chaperone GrpE